MNENLNIGAAVLPKLKKEAAVITKLTELKPDSKESIYNLLFTQAKDKGAQNE